MFRLFGKKVSCFQCDAKVKVKESKFRRGFRFCNDACVDAYLIENQLRPRDGDEASWREDAKRHLGLAFAEMTNILRASSVLLSPLGRRGHFNQAAAMHSAEDIKDSFARYNGHLLDALPFLYALGHTDDCTELESHDLDTLYDLSIITNDSAQMSKVRKLAEPVVANIERVNAKL